MIEVKGLTKYYGQIAAIEDVSFSVEAGEIIGFLGPNAAGKTTTMRILTGFMPASRGTARIAGFDVSDHPIEVKRRVGYLPESVPLYREMLVHKFLMYVATIKGIARRERTRAVGGVIERCGLGEMARRTIGHLSKGYRQRVGLAQALLGNPPVLILDEPTVGLDPRQIIEIRQVIKDLAQEHTILLSTHILPEVATLCERVLIINRGRVVTQDTMRNLTGAGGDVASFEVASPGSPDAVLNTLRSIPGVREARALGAQRFRVDADNSDRIRAGLAAALVEAGHGVTALREHARTLEEIFVEAVASDEGEQA